MHTVLVRFFQTTIQPTSASWALLLLRVIVGAAFVLHGWGKIQSPFSWMGEGSPVPAFFQFLAALSEFGGGFALIIGVLTRLASLGIGFTMIGAVYLHMIVKGDPFVGRGGSYELALVYLGIAMLLLILGPGKFSADAKLFGSKRD